MVADLIIQCRDSIVLGQVIRQVVNQGETRPIVCTGKLIPRIPAIGPWGFRYRGCHCQDTPLSNWSFDQSGQIVAKPDDHACCRVDGFQIPVAKDGVELPGDILWGDGSKRRQYWMLKLLWLQEQLPVAGACLPGKFSRQKLLGDWVVEQVCWICVWPQEKRRVAAIADITCQGLPQFWREWLGIQKENCGKICQLFRGQRGLWNRHAVVA